MAASAFYSCDTITDMDSIYAIQEPLRLEVNQTSISVNATAQVVTVTINSNGYWMTMGNSWCRLSAESGKGDCTLSIYIAQNTTEQRREGVIKIYSGVDVVYITITQDA